MLRVFEHYLPDVQPAAMEFFGLELRVWVFRAHSGGSLLGPTYIGSCKMCQGRKSHGVVVAFCFVAGVFGGLWSLGGVCVLASDKLFHGLLSNTACSMPSV